AIFAEIDASSVTLAWAPGTAEGGFNGPGATYLAQASTMATFLPVAASSLTANASASVRGLFVNATHYFRVRAYNFVGAANDWFALGSTVTAVEAPSTVVFDEVSSTTLIGRATA